MLTRRDFVLCMTAMAGASSALACPAPAPVKGAEGRAHSLLMLNAGCGDPDTPNVFEPAILRIQPGDSVTIVPTDEGHNSASKRGMIPDGAEPWNGALNEALTVTFTEPGLYGHICLPHYEWGMVGLIAVGTDWPNLKAARKVRHPGRARKVFRALFKDLQAEA